MVSVIVCVYNGAEFLPLSLASIFAQTYSDFEIVVIDDGSTDGSVAVAESFADPRLRVLRQSNRGAASALAAGIGESRGGYVAFLDQDDLWEPNKLGMHVERMERSPHIDLSFSWFRYIDSSGKPLGLQSIRYQGQVSFAGLLEDFVIGATSNAVVRREAIERAGGIDLMFPRLYDLDLFLRIARLRPGNIEAVPAELMSYRRHEAQISRDFTEMEAEWERLMAKMTTLSPEVVGRLLGRARVNIRRYFARLAYEQRNYRRALRYVKSGFEAAPSAFVSDPRNWLTAAACLAGAVLPGSWLREAERWVGLHRAH